MPDINESGTINPEQYTQYAAAWTELINSGNDEALAQAFQLLEAARLTFLTFSIGQITALVAAPGAYLIKARFLLMPDATGQPRFAATLFATDADNQRVSDYYVPTQPQEAAPTATDALAAPAESTKLPREVALNWLTDWVAVPELLFSFFTVAQEPVHGYNFELSTFTDPLAAAQPYDGKGLFLNLGLGPATQVTAKSCNLVVYIALLGSRQQGSVAGLPEGDVFYDHGNICPPAPFV